MYDDPSGETGIFDFDELANHLVEQGLQSSPSEIHGCVCGLLAAGAAVEPELALAALVDTLDLELRGELAERVMQLFQVSAAALEDEEFDFHPLLPDDETDLDTRVTALSGWCKGFLGGFALVSASASSASENVLSGDSADALKDFSEIALAKVEDRDREDEEEGEQSYFDLVDYLRFATLNIYMDSQDKAELRAEDGDHRPLH